MKRFCLITLFFLVIQSFDSVSYAQKSKRIRVAFWNFENFFDPFFDSTRHYNEFTENGGQHWTLSRFYKKRNNMYKAIMAMSESEPIAILGICEVENTYVTRMLFHETPLKKHNYRLIHYEGPDRRGIDVAIAYSVDKLQLISSEAILVSNPKDKNFRTRDILYAKFFDKHEDTLHCFVNHWSSRYGGEKETIYLRNMTARLLRSKIDSLIEKSEEIPKIVVMGDFNDSPTDESIVKYLRAVPLKESSKTDTLINLFANEKDIGFYGTLKHQYHWHIFDQIMISKSLLYDYKSLCYEKGSAAIFYKDFMLVDDETYGGKKLFRTYIGPKYHGGFSDHLPVYIDLRL